MGSHLLDLAQFLLGGPPTSVAAALDPVHTQRRPVGGPVRTCDRYIKRLCLHNSCRALASSV
jgi:predicted dehydrogenase